MEQNTVNMNSFWKTAAKKVGLLPIIKCLCRKWWGRYPCMCVETPKKAMGLTVNTKTGKVTHFWCAVCGGYRKTKGKYRIEIESRR